jgi:hypothetical protein
MFGGQTGAALASTDALVWSPQQGERALLALPAPRCWSSAHALPGGRTLVLGGTDAAGALLGDALVHEEA